MNTKQNTLKFIISGFIALVLIVMANLGIIMIKQPTFAVYANEYRSTLPISITNANFNNEKPSTFPDTSFAGFEADYKTTGNEKPSVKAGVINLEHDDYTNKYASAKRGSSYDSYVLMIESNSNIKYGYKTTASNSISISPNSYYRVTVDVYTETNSSIANLYLYDNNKSGAESIYSSIENINSYLDWQTYTFYISTNDLTSASLSIGMSVNGQGTAMFDSLSATQLSYEQYALEHNALSSEQRAYIKDVQDKNNIIAEYSVNHGSFNKTNAGNTTLAAAENIKNAVGITPLKQGSNNSIKTTVTNTDGKNSSAILIENSEKTYAQYSTDEDFLTFKQNELYKVSLNVKTEDLSGKANIQLVRTNAEENANNIVNSSVLEITSSGRKEENVTNDYLTYSFYVLADPYVDTTYKLVFGLGDSENPTSGKMYVNTLTISKIDYSTFSAANTTNKLDLSNYYSYSNASDLPVLNNGNFDAMQVVDAFEYKPAAPSNWSVTKGNNTQYYGVVNGSKFNKLEALNTSNLLNPFDSEENNNILMMYNATDDTLSYTSDTKSLTANSYYKFAVKVNTQINNNSTFKVALVSKVNDTEVELVSKNIKTAPVGFRDVALYLHTGDQALNVSLKVTLETTGCGYAYIDQARFNYPLQPTATEFNNADDKNSYIAKAELTNAFTNLNFYTSNNKNVVAKVINADIESDLTQFVIDKEAFVVDGLSDIIAVRSAYDVNYTLTSTLGYDMKANSYYKVSVDVYTQFIDSSNEEADEEKLGAGIKLVGFDKSFTAINSNNSWSTYTFYVTAASATTANIQFSLGDAENLTKGDAFFANITFENITEEEFNAKEDSSYVKVIKPEETNEEDSSTDTEEETKKEPVSLQTILYYASAIITAVAIIIAVVGISLRKIKFKKRVKKSKNEYDRNRTVSKQVYMRKATTERERKLAELNKDFETISNERIKFEEQYKKDLTKLRELKIKRANPAEISKLEKEMKRNQKSSASLGITLNKIQTEIDYAKTDAYLNALMKKLAKEAQIASNNSNADTNSEDKK